MSEENEQRLKEYQSNYLRAKKTLKMLSFLSLLGTKWNKKCFFVKILLIKVALIKMK